MADTKKKRTTAPHTKPKKTASSGQPRRKAPTSQYTDVGQRKPAPRSKPNRQATQPSRVTAASPAMVEEKTQTVVAAAATVTLQPTNLQPLAELAPEIAPDSSIGHPSAIPAPTRHRLPALLTIVVLVVAATGWALWRHQRQPNSVASLVREVGRVTVLPAQETPVVSTVVDKQHVTQAFLASAKNGDKVLLYYQAQKAIVYRPSTHQVITIGPITQGPARVFIRSGGTTSDAVQRIQATVASDASDFTAISRDDSPNPHYQSTVVVDLTGVRPDVANKLAVLLHAKVASLPAGESRPDGDMLVIAGKDAP